VAVAAEPFTCVPSSVFRPLSSASAMAAVVKIEEIHKIYD